MTSDSGAVILESPRIEETKKPIDLKKINYMLLSEDELEQQ